MLNYKILILMSPNFCDHIQLHEYVGSEYILWQSRVTLNSVFNKLTKLHGWSPLANYTDRLSDRRLSAKLVPTLADRGCRVVSATIPPQSLISVF
jgi:hypothetical protein